MEQIFIFEFVGEWYATKGNAAFGGGGIRLGFLRSENRISLFIFVGCASFSWVYFSCCDHATTWNIIVTRRSPLPLRMSARRRRHAQFRHQSG